MWVGRAAGEGARSSAQGGLAGEAASQTLFSPVQCSRPGSAWRQRQLGPEASALAAASVSTARPHPHFWPHLFGPFHPRTCAFLLANTYLWSTYYVLQPSRIPTLAVPLVLREGLVFRLPSALQAWTRRPDCPGPAWRGDFPAVRACDNYSASLCLSHPHRYKRMITAPAWRTSASQV